MLGLKGLIIAN